MNSCSISRTGNLVASGSDDGFVKLWDPRVRRSVAEFMNQYQVTAVCLSRDDQHVMSGGIDNDIKVFDVRKLDLAYTMPGHTDTVTGASRKGRGRQISVIIHRQNQVLAVSVVSRSAALARPFLVVLARSRSGNDPRSSMGVSARETQAAAHPCPQHIIKKCRLIVKVVPCVGRDRRRR